MSLVSLQETSADVAIDRLAILRYLKLDPADPKVQALLLVCDRCGLDPILKHMVMVDGNPYITRDGLLHVAHESKQFDGIEVQAEGETPTHWTAKVSVYRRDWSHPCTYTGRYPKTGSNKKYGPEMAVKGLALDTDIPTATGWTTMERIAVGDTVFDLDGQPVRVTATSEVKHLRCFKVTFRNGTSIVCDADHRWVATIAEQNQRVHTTEDLSAAKRDGKRVVMPVPAPVELPTADLPVDPWVLGYWLGNGSKDAPRVTAHGSDVKEVVAAIVSAGYEVRSVRADPRGNCSTIGIRGIGKALAALGVVGQKHVPNEYMRASEAQRRALLAGLMDSDGTSSRRRASFTSTEHHLRDAVAELARSLGERVTITQVASHGYGVDVMACRAEWTPAVVPFALSRKAPKLNPRRNAAWLGVSSVEEVAGVPTRCIAVDSPTRTYLASRDWVPTHNTAEVASLRRAFDVTGLATIEEQWDKADAVETVSVAAAKTEMLAGLDGDKVEAAVVWAREFGDVRTVTRTRLDDVLEHLPAPPGDRDEPAGVPAPTSSDGRQVDTETGEVMTP